VRAEENGQTCSHFPNNLLKKLFFFGGVFVFFIASAI
jgi:hypothetical protein